MIAKPLQFNRFLFEDKCMADELAEYISEKEGLTNHPNSFSYCCQHAYCPSSISVYYFRTGNNEERYYLSYIPHFHTSTLYPANPSVLPSFLQLVLYYHSGYTHFNSLRTSISSISPSSSLSLCMLNEEWNLFSSGWLDRLGKSALNDFGCSINDIDCLHEYSNSDLNGMI